MAATASNPASPDRKLTLFLGGQLIPLAVDEVDQVLETIIGQQLASKNPRLLRCCFIENVNWVQPAGQQPGLRAMPPYEEETAAAPAP